MRPPAVPQLAHVAAGGLFIRGEIGRFEKAGQAKENRFGVLQIFTQSFQRQSLRDERERKFVLFVTERGRDFLEKRVVGVMVRAGLAPVDLGPQSRMPSSS